MAKIIGRIMLIVTCIASFAHAGISLRVTDRQGSPIRQAVIGEPFNIELVSAGSMSDFQIDGLDTAIILLGQQAHSSQYINGTVTIKYTFSARGDKIGSYTIGPVTAKVNNVKESSNTVTIEVVTEQDVSKKNINEVFLRLALDKKKVMVGEQIAGTARFYTSKDDVSLDQLIPSDFSAFTVSPMSEPVYGKEVIDDLEYNYLEITWTMAPKKEGYFTIPAWSAQYSVPLLSDLFGPFRLMQSLQRQQKRVYSNALCIDVTALPSYKGALHGVGNFDDVSIHASSQVTKEGEANVIRLDVIGDGTFEGYEPLQLVGVPDGLKSYESKQYSDVLPNGKKKTSYEFIVQGVKSGDWQIPSQEFTYFDIARKSYVTLKTMPLSISVLAQPGLKTVVATNIASDAQAVESIDADNKNGLRLSKSGAWHSQQYREIGLHWFLLLLIVPFGLLGLSGIQAWYKEYRLRREPLLRKKYAHAHAYKSLVSAEKRKAYHELYPIFVELFASRSESSIPECSDDTIITLLRVRGLSQDDVASWQRFFTDIMRLAYAGSGQQSKATNDIIKRSYEWLERLKGVL